MYVYIHIYIYVYTYYVYMCMKSRGSARRSEGRRGGLGSGPAGWKLGTQKYNNQGPPEYGRSCDYREQVTIIAYYSL